VLALDIPSGMPSDGEPPSGEVARADYTVTFTALKRSHALPPNCDVMGEIRVAPIGTPDSLLETTLHVTNFADFQAVLAPRARDTNKGTYGHVLVVGGAEGKTGAAEMAGLAALRAGAGLVTVACSDARLRTPELMTSPLPRDAHALHAAAERKIVVAVGPGLGLDAAEVVCAALDLPLPVVLDADALNLIAGSDWRGTATRVITPHPGEMARLCGCTIAEIQADRVAAARAYAAQHNAIVVLKGHRSITAFPDGRAFVNPTGSPAMATGGSGDILTGLIAGLLAQFDVEPAVLGAVYLHGLAGELGAAALGEPALIATDLLQYLPEAMRACAAC
jgi:NAD(P)H-hydrate epimerase